MPTTRLNLPPKTWKKGIMFIEFDGTRFWYGSKILVNYLSGFSDSFVESKFDELKVEANYRALYFTLKGVR
jgi:hypothetical protein